MFKSRLPLESDNESMQLCKILHSCKTMPCFAGDQEVTPGGWSKGIDSGHGRADMRGHFQGAKAAPVC